MIPLTPSSDIRRELPASHTARRDAIATAIDSLRGEQRRLERLGFELPIARCHDQIRYWQFLSGLFAAASSPAAAPSPSRPWRADRTR